MTISLRAGLFAGAILVAAPVALMTASAQAPAPPAASEAPAAPQAYRPGLGDLMTTTVQPRHTKLAFALREKNWRYAAYEAHELEEAFDRLAQVWPEWRKIQITGLVDTMIREPIRNVAQAIKEKDEAKFAETYAKLTDGCNACHQAARRVPIVIQVPDAAMFPDQDFRPKQ
jgi:hypothetical protein